MVNGRQLVGTLALALGACGVTENEKADPATLSVEDLVQESMRPCVVKPPHPGSCGPGHRHSNGPGDSRRSRTITIAQCNGVDDTAVIQDALDRADEVRLPAGTCAVDGLAVEKKPIRLLGQGRDRTILKYRGQNAANCVLFINGGHTVIADLTIDGSRDVGGVVGGIFVRPKTCVGPVVVNRVDIRNVVSWGIVVSGDGVGTMNGVVDNDRAVGASPVVIVGNRVTNSEGGIYVGTTSVPNLRNVQIQDNSVQVDVQAGIQVRGAFNVQVTKNRTTGGNVGIGLESGGQYVTIADNDLEGATVAGFALGGGALNTGSDIVLERNHVTACGTGVVVNHMTRGRFSRVSIADNELSGNTIAGVTITAGASIVVARNHLQNNGVAGLLVGGAPDVGCTDRCTSIDDLAIAGNVFRAGMAVTGAGLSVDNPTARGIVVRGNDLRFDAPAPPYRPVYVVNGPAAGDLTFDDNQGWPVLVPAP